MSHSHSIKQYPGQMAGIVAAGAAIGAGVALLLAPKSGADTRKQLKAQVAGMKQKMQSSNFGAKVGDTAEKSADKIKATATDVKTGAKSAAREVKSGVKKSSSDNKDMTDEIRRNGEP